MNGVNKSNMVGVATNMLICLGTSMAAAATIVMLFFALVNGAYNVAAVLLFAAYACVTTSYKHFLLALK